MRPQTLRLGLRLEDRSGSGVWACAIAIASAAANPLWCYAAARAVVRAVLIAVMAAFIAVARGPPAPNARDTTAMIQAATIRYSNDTTPSWSAHRRFNVSVILTQYFSIGEIPLYKMNLQPVDQTEQAPT